MKKALSVSPENSYLGTVVVPLGVTGLAKLYSAAGDARVFTLADPLLLLKNKEVFLVAALVELAVAAHLVFSRNTQSKHLIIACLSLNYIVYRLGLWWVAPGKPCPCLGTLAERVPLRPDKVDLLLKLIILYMLGGSLFFLLFGRAQGANQRCSDAVVRS